MTKGTGQEWPYPGSRWWKFDFHTHTPASKDTYWAQNSVNLSPEDWLLRCMQAGIDCVAVTDHNSGQWIDKLKTAYAKMKRRADTNTASEGFRELVLFPGVEISVQGGFHLLAILDPTAGTGDINTLLGRVGFGGTKGESDAVTRKGAAEVVKEVLNAGGIPIPAHADGPKGLLRLEPNNRSTQLDANTVRQVLDENGILAMEVIDRNQSKPDIYGQRHLSWTEVLGSDCHGFQSNNAFGSRYTWIKMAKPSLQGLRLALLDGADISVRRSDEGHFEPFKTPVHFVTAIEIEKARFMGNGNRERFELTPFYNALIGGRGTGKSTVVQAMRLAYRRDQELTRLRNDTDIRRGFERFIKVVKGRTGNGALRENTEIRAELVRDGVAHRLRWRQDGQGRVVEERDESNQWQTSESEAVSPERFPIRLLSQGQIAEMAGENRQALLNIIDEAADVEKFHRALNEEKRAYFSQRAKLRELEGRLAEKPELMRKLADLTRKLTSFGKTRHGDVLAGHQLAVRQRREIDTTLDQLKAIPKQIKALSKDFLLDDWPEGTFESERDADVLGWRSDAEETLSQTRKSLRGISDALEATIRGVTSDDRLGNWRKRAHQAQTDYDELQRKLQTQGVADPQEFGRLVHGRQQLEGQAKDLEQVQEEVRRLQAECESQRHRVVTARKDITKARADFLKSALQSNAFVKMEVVAFGFETRVFERSLRDLLDAPDERFERDILRMENGEPAAGMAYELAQAEHRENELSNLKQRIIGMDGSFNGHFRNYLQARMKKPEFADHVQCWFPEDDLRIEYNRGGNNWAQITEGSQGQRSAALLAFLLAFGDEPLVLDQPEDDLDNHLIYDLIVRQIRENKLRRQLIIVTHNPNVVINGDAEMVHALGFRTGQCQVLTRGALQEPSLREEVCRVMEGGREAFARRWARLGRDLQDV